MTDENRVSGRVSWNDRGLSRLEFRVLCRGVALVALMGCVRFVEGSRDTDCSNALVGVVATLEESGTPSPEVGDENRLCLDFDWLVNHDSAAGPDSRATPLPYPVFLSDQSEHSVRFKDVVSKSHYRTENTNSGVTAILLAQADVKTAKKRDPKPAVSPKTFGIPLVPRGGPALVRELVRQSLFLCAQDSFGVVPSDELLRELSTPGLASPRSDQSADSKEINGSTSIAVSVALKESGKDSEECVVSVQVLRMMPVGSEEIFSREISSSVGQIIAAVATNAEGWSRNEFIGVLEAAGLKQEANPDQRSTQPGEGITKQIEELLNSHNPISQMLALRLLEKQFADEASSVEVASATARSYALLGSLIELNWSSMHKLMKARGLIMAERSVRLWPESALAWQSRGYVRALAGLHELAIADFKKAESLKAESSPDWATAAAAFCRWDDVTLDELAAGENRFALYFRLLAAEIIGTPRECIIAATTMWESDHDCWRAMSALGNATEIGIGHAVTARALPSIHEGLPRLLKQTADLRSELTSQRAPGARQSPLFGQLFGSKKTDSAVDEIKIITRGLRKLPLSRGKGTFPISWQAMSAIIEDSLFQGAVQILGFQRYALAVDPSDYLEAMKILLEDHPLVASIDYIHPDRDRSDGGFDALESEFIKTRVSTGSASFFTHRNEPRFSDLKKGIMGQRDKVLSDVTNLSTRPQANLAASLINDLTGLAPGCPLLTVTRVTSDWENCRDQAPAWEMKYPRYSRLFRELARRYEADENIEEAARCYRRVADLTGDPNELVALADYYHRLDDWDNRRKVLEESLDLPAVGLEHASAASQIAYGYMERDQWEEALPFAQMAAESYSEWGLQCAAHCYEGLEDWETAEKYQRAISGRYEGSEAEWYFWCRRTGRGDAEAAKELAERALNESVEQASYWTVYQKALMLKLEGDTKEAYRLLRELAGRHHNPNDQFLAAIWASDVGLVDERNELLGHVFNEFARDGSGLVARLVLKALHGDAEIPGDEVLTFCLLTSTWEGAPTVTAFFIAESLRMLGKPDQAVKWYQLCCSSPVDKKKYAVLAGGRLVELGIKVEGRHSREVEDIDPRLMRLLGSPQREWEIKKFQPGLDRYRKAVRMKPEYAWLQYAFGVQLLNSLEYHEAQTALSKAIESAPLMAEIFVVRAEARLGAGNPAGAINDLESALKASPNDAVAHYRLALLLATHPDDGVRNLERARRHAEVYFNHPLRWEHLSLSLKAVFAADSGRFDEAVRLQKEADALAIPMRRSTVSNFLRQFLNNQPCRQDPTLVALLSSLPSDGTWARYRVVFTASEKRHEGKVEVRSVGQFEKDGEKVRAIEVEIQSESRLFDAEFVRLIVPESECGFWKMPTKSIRRMWSGTMGDIGERAESDPTRGNMLIWFAGPKFNIRHELSTVMVGGPREKMLKCQVFGGTSVLGLTMTLPVGSWTIKKSADVPFALVAATVNVSQPSSMNVELTLEDFGDGAKASMPELVP